jgi:hypothetical protein
MKQVVPTLVSPSDDPRATGGIRRAKAWGGLAGFAVAGLGAYMHGDVLADAAMRGLVGGFVGWVVAWAAALAIWRRIMRAEALRAVEMQREKIEAAAAAQAAAAAAIAAQSEAASG